MAAGLESILAAAWQTRGPLACALWPVSLMFGGLSAMRRGLYRAGVLRSHKFPVPVIVVGNVFVGGTGKTPFTLWLIDALRQRGFKPGVISRGYGADGEVREVSAASLPAQAGDEPVLLAQRSAAPLFVGRDRPAAARALLAAHPEVNVLISDDGLQHYALARDVEIVLFDARGAGNGWMLPAGPLREAASRPRDFTVVNAPQGGPQGFRMTLAGAEAVSLKGERQPLAALKGKSILAAAGIGDPRRFFATLRSAGLDVEELPLPDHFAYASDPFEGKTVQIILVTEKDAVKLRHHPALAGDARIHYVPVAAQIDGPLAEHIVEKLRG